MRLIMNATKRIHQARHNLNLRFFVRNQSHDYYRFLRIEDCR